MNRSVFAGLSGLKNNQIRMDVVANNIANSNTVAFKSGRVLFKDAYSQTLSAAVRPSDNLGGANPQQVGLGVRVSSIDTLFSQGSLEVTGNPMDMAIQGEGMFVVRRADQLFYTRDGSFKLDGEGRLVTANGYRVQGRMASTGVLQTAVTDLSLPISQQVAARATEQVTMGGNLDASTAVGDSKVTSIQIFDSQGTQHELRVTLTKTANVNEWQWDIDPAAMPGAGTITPNTGLLQFDATGQLIAPATAPSITINPAVAGQFDPIVFNMDFGSGGSGVTQFSGASTAVLNSQDGYTSGSLETFQVDPTGTIVGAFSNGVSQVLGQIAMAEFTNPGGLTKQADNLWSASPNSGSPITRFADGEDSTQIISGVLEMSNVDLAAEFSNMMITQRGFQANGKTITSADEMAETIIMLKR